MSVVYATEYDEFCSRLSHRDATAVAQGAANPYAVTIVPNGDPSLDLSNAQLSTTLARRLCIPQLTHPSLSDAAEQTNVCPTCQQRHANGHLDQALVCYSCGNSGRTRWHSNVHTARSGRVHQQCGPPQPPRTPRGRPRLGRASGRRVQLAAPRRQLSLLGCHYSCCHHGPVRRRTLPLRRGSPHKKAGHAEAREKPDAREATFPGLAADKHEYAKTRKHGRATSSSRWW